MTTPHNTNEKRRNRIIELMNDDEQDLTPQEIDSIIMDEFECSRDAARKARKRILAAGLKDEDPETVGDESDKCTYNYADRQYEFIFYSRDINGGLRVECEFDIPFDQMQEYVAQYTYAGGNLTRKQVCTYAYMHHERVLTHDYLRRIMKCINIQKASNPFAPHKYEEDTKGEIVASWHARDEAMVEAQYYAGFQRKTRNMLRKKVAELNSIKDFVVAVVEEAEFSGLPECDLDFSNRYFEMDRSDQRFETFSLLSDWHIGLEMDAWYNRFNLKIAKDRVDDLLEQQFEYYKQNKERVIVNNSALLGDMLDGVHGDMHPDQHIEQHLRGVEQAVSAADLLAYYITQQAKIFPEGGKVYGTPGNHDRDAKDRKGDPQRATGMLVYEIAKYKAVGVDPSQWVLPTDRPMIEAVHGNYLMLMGHGDKTPRKIRNMAWPRLRAGMHMVAVTGHLHSVQLQGIFDANFTHIQNGSLCGSTSYSFDQLGFHNYPAQVMIELTQNGVVPRPFFLKKHGCEDFEEMYSQHLNKL